jgi:hypothetical protein
MTLSATQAAAPRSGPRIVLIVVGAVAALLSVAAIVGGVALVTIHETQRDADGYYASGASRLTTPTHAFVADDLDVGADGPDWLFHDAGSGPSA